MPARMTLGEGPTNSINSIIITIVIRLATRLLKNGPSAAATIAVRIVMFIPESATIWRVPVATNAAYNSLDSVAFVPKRIPDKRPAWGSGKSWLMMVVKVPTDIGHPRALQCQLIFDLFKNRLTDSLLGNKLFECLIRTAGNNFLGGNRTDSCESFEF